MSTNTDTTLCREVEENLAQVLDGTAPASLYDHIADCDVCRDLRHEAGMASELVASAGADFRPSPDFAEALVARLDAALVQSGRVSGARSGDPSGSTLMSEPATLRGGTSAAPVSIVDPIASAVPMGSSSSSASAPATDPIKMGEARIGGAVANAPTTLAALAGAQAAASPQRAPTHGTIPLQGLLRDERPDASAPRTETGTLLFPAVDGPLPAPAAVPSTITSEARAAASPTTSSEAAQSAQPRQAMTPSPVESRSAAVSSDSAARAEAGAPAEARPAVTAPAKTAPKPGGARIVPFYRRPGILAGAVGAMAAAAAAGLFIHAKLSPGPATATTEGPWSGTVATIARASADKSGGLEVCDKKGKCWEAAQGAEVKAGWKLKTDARTRAHVALADGTELAIDRGSELVLGAGHSRSANLVTGAIVADVAKVERAAPARFSFSRGEVEVWGTKLALTADADRGTVEVIRGTVKVRDDGGKTVEVRAGEEATLLKGSDPVVANSTSLADVLEWSDRAQEEVDAPVLRGLGELKARKPGQTQEKERAVRLAKHSVKVRVVDVVARTEVDETFTNDTDEELEGIFRFPLPPGAQIEKLSLEVEGKLIDGAFVDREKGAAIWRGVIQNAAPKTPRPREEIIWVPGPWRDPALLEWQRGGRFELKIFPIPRRGSRRVVLTYTQTVEQTAGLRRFTYPLAHDPSGTTTVGAFDLDLQVLGADKSVGLSTRGYELASATSDGAAERRTFHADNFVPAGDLTVEFALPDRDRELTAWAYKMEQPWNGPASPTSTVTTGPASGKPETVEDKAAREAATAIASDASPYVAIALRPKLPRWQEAKERTHVIVVDSSRSMFGERWARASRLASSIVREMDRRDSFVLLACDTTCRPMTTDGARTPTASAPGAAAAGEVERFLGTIEPDGGSDLAAAMSAARSAAGRAPGRELRILYLGDGTPSVGPTTPSHLEAAVRAAVPPGDAAIVAVALGADADTTSLAAMARGGGGVMMPYVPGQRVATAAVDVLGAAYGVVLRDPEIELPPGLAQVTPARMDPIRAGGETFVVARMTGNEVAGTVRLKGRVAGERFEQSYPLKVVATSSAGNAFVPRLYAAGKIAELERTGGQFAKPSIVELSRRFAVASRYTSLLVLESEAMFNAFGLQRGSVAPSFTGELGAQSSSADAEGESQEETASAATGDEGGGSRARRAPAKKAPGGGDLDGEFDKRDSSGFGRSGGGLAGPMATSAAPATPAPKPASRPADDEPRKDAKAEEKPNFAPPPPAQVAADPLGSTTAKGKVGRPIVPNEPWNRPRRMVPMRRVFDRKASFEAVNSFVGQNASKLVVAESALQSTPDSRDKTVELFALYATSGRLGEAQELTAKWSGRDALDPDAIVARADLAARQGDRERAIRILGGLADVRPGDKAPQQRLAELHEAAGNTALACEHRLTLADLSPSDSKTVADAVRCARNVGLSELASLLKADAPEKVRDAIERALAAAPPAQATQVRGDVQVSAEWNGGGDLDVALVDAQGRRYSWLGGTAKNVSVTARDVMSPRSESLGLVNLPSGNYVVEISRASGGDVGDVARGEVTLRLPGGETRKVPFQLTGARAEVGTVRVFFTSRLVPVSSWDFGF